ncbi:LINE-1 retrotransposable element ORF2 protein [Durusdinium trenchii]|uniref:LINE-1 retrotransposable element ORF2 protein n=1 Tax=Durusdinium trenchii TaxID=1381693 RepID=A0ABP0QHR0_9DINO
MGFIPGRSPYEILGVPEGSGMAVVRKRFFREARRWHPDKHQGDSEEEIENAHLRFVQIHAAYQAILREGILEGPRQQADAPTFENEAFQRWTRERHLEQRLDEAEEAHENTKAELDEINDYLETQRDLARNQALYTAEEFEAIRASWNDTMKAQLLLQNREQQYKAQVNKLRMRQKHLQQLSRSQSAPPKSRRSEEEPEKEPKSLMDATESALCYLGESVTQTCMDVSIFCGELAEEVTDAMSSMAAYFRAWRIVRDDE